MNITWKGAKAFTKGRDGHRIKHIAIHWVGKGDLESANAWFNRPKAKTSAHYGVEDDVIYQWVKDEDTAYAVGNWVGNLESISIEHSATPDRLATEQTYITGAKLIRSLCEIYNLPIDKKTIRPHSFYRATACPGTMDLDKLIRLAKEEPMSANLFDPTKDISSEWESELGLKDYEVYDLDLKRMNVKEIVAYTDNLYHRYAGLIKEMEDLEDKYSDKLDDLREANGLELEKLNKPLRSISEALSEVDGGTSLEKVNHLLERILEYENIVPTPEEVNTVEKKPAIEALKEIGRLVLFGIIGFGISYLASLPETETTVLVVALLRYLDKFLHEQGKLNTALRVKSVAPF